MQLLNALLSLYNTISLEALRKKVIRKKESALVKRGKAKEGWNNRIYNLNTSYFAFPSKSSSKVKAIVLLIILHIINLIYKKL